MANVLLQLAVGAIILVVLAVCVAVRPAVGNRGAGKDTSSHRVVTPVQDKPAGYFVARANNS